MIFQKFSIKLYNELTNSFETFVNLEENQVDIRNILVHSFPEKKQLLILIATKGNIQIGSVEEERKLAIKMKPIFSGEVHVKSMLIIPKTTNLLIFDDISNSILLISLEKEQFLSRFGIKKLLVTENGMITFRNWVSRNK